MSVKEIPLSKDKVHVQHISFLNNHYRHYMFAVIVVEIRYLWNELATHLRVWYMSDAYIYQKWKLFPGTRFLVTLVCLWRVDNSFQNTRKTEPQLLSELHINTRKKKYRKRKVYMTNNKCHLLVFIRAANRHRKVSDQRFKVNGACKILTLALCSKRTSRTCAGVGIHSIHTIPAILTWIAGAVIEI